MPTETEHKYLVDPQRWKSVKPEKSLRVKQAYLHSDPTKTIRVRVMGGQGFITIKGKTTGASRTEYEYEIPLQDAEELIAGFTTNLVEKIRHYVNFAGKTWEVDEFGGLNAGLLMAEIELGDEQEQYDLPEWVLENITTDKRYSNSNLAIRPFSTW